MESCANNSDLCTGPANGDESQLPPWKKELIRKRRQVHLPSEAPEEQEAETSTGDQNKSDRGRTRSRAAPSRAAAGLVAALQAVYEPRVDSSKSPSTGWSSSPPAHMAATASPPGVEKQPASNPHPAGVSHSTGSRAPAEGFTSASRSVSANGRAHIRSTILGGVLQTQSHVTSSASAKTWISTSSVPLKTSSTSSSTTTTTISLTAAATRVDKMVEEKRPARSSSDVVVTPPWRFSAKNVNSVHYREHNNEDEELQYGPGIVNKLKSRYLSRTLREKSHSERPSLRRAASLEDWLDKEDPPVAQPIQPRPTTLNTSSQSGRNYPLKKTGSTENCGLGNKRSVSVSDLYIAPSLSGAMRGRTAQRGGSSPSPVKPNIPPVKEEIVIIEKSPPAPVEAVKKPVAPAVAVAPLKSRRLLPTTTLYGVEDGELPPPDTVRQVKSIFERDARKTGSSRRSQSAGPSTNRIPLSLAKAATNDESRTPARTTPTKTSAPISPKPSPLGPKPTVLPPKPALGKARPTQPPPPLPQSPVAPPPTTPRVATPAAPVVVTPPPPASSPAVAAPRPALSTPTQRPAAPAPAPPPAAKTPPPAPATAPTTPAVIPVSTPKPSPSISPPTSQSSNRVAPPTSDDAQSDSLSSGGSDDDETGPGEGGKGVKKISRGALDNIRKEGTSQVFSFGTKAGGSSLQQQQPLPQQQQPVKQVGIIRPLTIDSVKVENIEKRKSVEDSAPVPELIKPPPVAVDPTPPPAKVAPPAKAPPRNNEAPPPTAAPAKSPTETNNPNVNVNGVGNNNNNKAKKRHQEQSSTTVFNFTERKQVPDHIHNDGVKRPIARYKRDDPGIVILVRPGGTNESSDYIEDADDEVDFLRRPPSPCNVHFEGWNVVINGRSSLQRQPKPRKLNISFNDEMTMLFEYPSEISLLLDDTDDTPTKPLLATTPSSTGNLASYTPSKVVVGETFELGVSRIVSSTPKANPEPSPAPAEEYLKPADVETTWSAETSADLLF